jgi:hypothetical protein
MPSSSTCVLVGVLVIGGCTGQISPGAPYDSTPPPTSIPPANVPPVDRPPPPAMVPPGADTCVGTFAAPAPARRLTRAEYDNTVRDLLGTTLRPARAFAPDGDSGGFLSNVDAPITNEGMAGQYLAAARALADEASLRLPALMGCTPTTRAAEDQCAQAFIDSFGRRALRRPLTAPERTRYQTLYGTIRNVPGTTFAEGVRALVMGFLLSPTFLNHVEVGAPATGGVTVVPLLPYEIAARLSYALLETMPDPELLRAAEANELATADQVAAQARRLLGNDNARSATWTFFERWLQLDRLDGATRDTGTFPLWKPGTPKLMARETRQFIDQVVFSGDGRLSTLLSAPYTFVDSSMGAISQIYGNPAATGGVQRLELDQKQRAGLLTQPGFLTAHAKTTGTDPVRRGLFVREQLLCQHVPPPGIVPEPPPETPALTTRQRYEMHMSGSCGACHQYINPPGFVFETYDQVGQYRTTENTWAVDGSMNLVGSGALGPTGLSDVDGMYPDYVSFARKLATSADVRACFSRQYMTFALKRAVGVHPGELCALNKLATEFNASGETGGNVTDMIVAVVRNDTFRNRTAITGACQ